MRNKRIIVTLLAAASIALAVMYTMMNMGAQHPGAKPQTESKPTSPAISANAEQPQNAAQAKKPAGGEKAKVKLSAKKYNPATKKHEMFIEKKLPPHSK